MGNSLYSTDSGSFKGKPMNSFFSTYSQTDAVLGKGSYGEIRLATKDGAEFAVKTLEKEKISADKEKVSELYNEVAVLERLNHPNIVRFYDWYEDAKTVKIVMSAAKNGSLLDYLHSTNDHTENDCRRIVRKIVEALKHCHDQGVVHRDIKPENILIGSDKERFEDLCLADFGLSIDLENEQQTLETKCGSLCYVAPEVLNSSTYDYKCDIWSLGIVAYLLVSGGFHPFLDADKDKVKRNVQRGKWQFGPATAWMNVSASAKDFITKCLNTDPEARYSYEQLLEHEWIAGNDLFGPSGPIPNWNSILTTSQKKNMQTLWKKGTKSKRLEEEI
mmetsp:Transcript_5304/g.6174  ORF Transcript_5304/g.6174 Transcript_5304/m.6174 type:complete len:332 (+) Transcript_5304:169-1164(+)